MQPPAGVIFGHCFLRINCRHLLRSVFRWLCWFRKMRVWFRDRENVLNEKWMNTVVRHQPCTQRCEKLNTFFQRAGQDDRGKSHLRKYLLGQQWERMCNLLTHLLVRADITQCCKPNSCLSSSRPSLFHAHWLVWVEYGGEAEQRFGHFWAETGQREENTGRRWTKNELRISTGKEIRARGPWEYLYGVSSTLGHSCGLPTGCGIEALPVLLESRGTWQP